jgi:hypothetical protein
MFLITLRYMAYIMDTSEEERAKGNCYTVLVAVLLVLLNFSSAVLPAFYLKLLLCLFLSVYLFIYSAHHHK